MTSLYDNYSDNDLFKRTKELEKQLDILDIKEE